MRRPAAVVGFSWFFALLAGTFCPIGGTMALLLLCLAAGVVSLFVRPLRIVKVVPTALLTAAVAMGSICLATFLTVLPIQSLDGVNCRVEGVITDLPTPKGERMLYPVKVTSVDADGAPQEFNIFLSSYAFSCTSTPNNPLGLTRRIRIRSVKDIRSRSPELM